jgi:hypothetical protein
VSTDQYAVVTVGDLRRLMTDLPDNYPIVFQVVAKNGQAWNMCADFVAKPKYLTWAALLQMKHDELERLPNEGFTGREIAT